MNPLELIGTYYTPKSVAHDILVEHSLLVTGKALAVAARLEHLEIDLPFLEEAAMLHDIGIFKTHAPGLDCHGQEPYLRHGVLGKELLERLGFPKHALVCERHIGTGITRREVVDHGLPLPDRDMVPVSLEEQIVCYADKFFSKGSAQEKAPTDILRSLARFGAGKVTIFEAWLVRFGG